MSTTGVELREENGHLQGVLRGHLLEIRRGGVVTVYDVRSGRRVETRREQREQRRAEFRRRLGVNDAGEVE